MSERSATELYLASNSGVTESLFGGGEGPGRGGGKGGPDIRLGGGWARGRYCNDFSPSHLLCTIKSQMVGANWGPMV